MGRNSHSRAVRRQDGCSEVEEEHVDSAPLGAVEREQSALMKAARRQPVDIDERQHPRATVSEDLTGELEHPRAGAVVLASVHVEECLGEMAVRSSMGASLEPARTAVTTGEHLPSALE